MRVLALLMIVLVSGCSEAASPDDLQAFRTLDLSMSLEEIRSIVGEPDRDVGSGISIYVYPLSDGSEVFLGWAGDRLVYVNHGDEQLLPVPVSE